jgi:hypothetical protein
VFSTRSSGALTGPRRFGTTVLILAIVLAVTGCTRATSAPVLTARTIARMRTVVPTQASKQMQSLVRDTMAAAGGKWTSTSDGPSPDACTTPSGEEGVSFSWDQIADGVDQPRTVMERVDRLWRDKGFATNTQSVKRVDGEILNRVGSQDDVVDVILFSATTSRMVIEVQSFCGTGNVDDFMIDGD